MSAPATRVDYTPLTGGLDVISGAMNVAPGLLSECLNFEQVFGKQGYRRIDGYERFDGRAQPHQARYWLLAFDAGGQAPAVGEVVQAGDAGGEVLDVRLDSGAWVSGDAAGVLVLTLVEGEFAAGAALTVGGVTVATVQSAAQPGSVSEAQHAYWLTLARESLRADITQPPGSGPVLGVAVYRGDVYAARDADDGLTAAVYKSTPAGWQSIRTGLLPGGRFRFEVANFSGAATAIALFGVDGKNRSWRWDGSTFTHMPSIYGTQASSTSSVEIGTGNKTFAIVESTRSWTAGQELTVHNTANAALRMTGKVVSYSAGSLVLNVAEIAGSGTHAGWEIGRADFRDKPYIVRSHKDHLFLAYPLGQLQSSNLGDPMTYTTTASLFGMGDEITGIVPLKGALLGVFCLNKISMLKGSSSLDWVMETYSSSAGAKHDTAHEMAGNAIFLDDRGLTSLQATQNFGDFEPSIFSRNVKQMLDVYSARIVGSRVAKTKFQYRLYADDGVRLSATVLTPDALVRPQDVAFTRQQYAHLPTCTAYGDMNDGSEGLFFGTRDGWVMREDVGTSFDGDAISAVMRLHFNHLKSPANKKRFRKLDVELESPGTALIRFLQQFDYSDGFYPASLTHGALALGGGGQWDASGWDTFLWSMPVMTKAEANIDGVGRNMGLLIWHESATDAPFTLQGLLLQYSILGMSR